MISTQQEATAPSASSVSNVPVDHLLVSRRRLIVLVVGLIVPWLLVAFLFGRYGAFGVGTESATVDDSVTQPLDEAAVGAKGPWGELEYTRITIAPPLALNEDLDPQRVRNKWQFPNYSLAKLQTLLTKAGIPRNQRNHFLTSAVRDSSIRGYVIDPDPKDLWSLSPRARRTIHTQLGLYPPNTDQARAYFFSGESLDEWLRCEQLSQHSVELINKLIYRNGRTMCFSDLSLLLSEISDEQERTRVVHALSHQSTIQARLRVRPDSDIDALVEYWGRGGRHNTVRPILESLSELPGGGMLNIADLLPPFARWRLYTYTPALVDESNFHRDCHWSALNFFSERDETQSAEKTDEMDSSPAVYKTFKDNYYPVFSDLQLGDLVTYHDGDGRWYHTAVYVADDIVFTKNGIGSTKPWMLLTLEEMKDYYPERDPVTVRYFRHKGL